MKVFVDTNVFMYCLGTDHPMKRPCQRIVQAMADGKLPGVIDTEVLQEILYRYRAIGRMVVGLEAARHATTLVTEVLPVRKQEMIKAMELLESDAHFEVRDAIHAAAALLAGITDVLSVDRVFDRVPGLRRVDPVRFP
jgi:predicted nucleic acid-binding protein